MFQQKKFTSLTGSILRDKFIAFFVLAATIPLLLLGTVALVIMHISHQHDIAQREHRLIDEKEKEIEAFFANTLGVLELRLDLENQETTTEWKEQFTKEILKSNPAFTEVSFTNLNGQEVDRQSRDGITRKLLQISGLKKFQTARKGENHIGAAYHTLSGPMLTIASPV